jgi:hypothetical protein
MKADIRIEGIEKASKELNRRLGKIRTHTAKGLISGGLLVLHASQTQVPVRWGNLRGSGFMLFLGRGMSETHDGSQSINPKGSLAENATYMRKVAETKDRVEQYKKTAQAELSQLEMGIVIGYAAEYAAKQHETPPGVYSHKGKGKWKFLEDALKEEADNVVRVVAKMGRRGLMS